MGNVSGVTDTGSSPLARGAHSHRPRRRPFERLIPAGAGSTRVFTSRQMLNTAHPRWRGEHCSTSDAGAGAPGSSPLARGALRFPLDVRQFFRLIPAGAGSTP